MIRRLPTLVLVLLLAISSASAKPEPHFDTDLPVESGMIASPNVELLATIPDVGATGGRFTADGKHFIATISGPYPALSPQGGVRIFDVSNPELPVPAGSLLLPHTENEDVDVSESRKLILVSQDNVSANVGGALYVVDYSNINAPLLKGVLRYPSSVRRADGATVGGPGHIASCIADCARYAWIGGARNGSILVVDLLDAANPKVAGWVTQAQNPAGAGNASFRGGIIHDVNVDPSGAVWTTGSGGTTMLDATNPLAPVLKYRVTTADNNRWNQFIHHNSLRLDAQTVLVTEEDWQQPDCGNTGTEQGGFQTWRVPTTTTGTLTQLDHWVTEVGRLDEGTAPAIVTCSSHWFTFNANKIAAVGWYNQGLRFLDVSNPSDIRQVGYWLGPASMASAGYFVPGRNDIAYAIDYQRGIDVLRIAGGGASARTVRAPVLPQWREPAKRPVTFAPDDVFGYACMRRA